MFRDEILLFVSKGRCVKMSLRIKGYTSNRNGVYECKESATQCRRMNAHLHPTFVQYWRAWLGLASLSSLLAPVSRSVPRTIAGTLSINDHHRVMPLHARVYIRRGRSTTHLPTHLI